MDTETNLIEPLIERVETYGKANIELLKLRSLDKTADVLATLSSRLLLGLVLCLFVLTLNIALALWLGDLLGKNHYGFLIVALFYGLLGLALHAAHPKVKARINDTIIVQMLH